MRVLVTGACGFVGSYLVKELCLAGHEVDATVFNKDQIKQLSSTGRDLEKYAKTIIPLDVSNQAQCIEVLSSIAPEAVFHLAGIAFAPQAAKNFVSAITINVGGAFNICQAINELKIPRIPFILASSGEVYGGVAEELLPINEDFSPAPMNPYSVTKLQAEEVINYFSRRGIIKGIIARPFNHIGPGQAEDFVCSSFAAQLARIAKGQKEPMLEVGNLEALRDFMDVRDVVRGYLALLNAESGIYNFSSGTSVKIDDILHILIDISSLDISIKQDTARMRPSEVKEIRGSFNKMYKLFGWKPEIDIESSLKDIYQDWLDRVSA